jgi:hypothetical protein
MDNAIDKKTGMANVIHAPDDATSMDRLAHAVLDDTLYNIISDLVAETHRKEKAARAVTAAIKVEKLASDSSESSTPDSRPDVRVETDAAIYEDGKVLLKGNPLQTTPEILCPQCHLPRLLFPTDGKGAKKPDPNVTYCKKQPYITKAGCDIYGQSWVAPGPGRGKKKKDMEKNNPELPPDQRPANVLSFPSATCSKCKRCILVTRLNNHMGSCIGNSGRNASRAAAQKMSNGGSQNDTTPPSSQKATPAPGSRAASPKKRDASDDEDDSETSHKKKKIKTSAVPLPANSKKVIIKTKPSFTKKDKIKGASQLSQEQKADYDDDAPDTSVEVAPKKQTAPNKNISPAKKLKALRPPLSSPMSKRDADGESESSGTLSSPPAHAAQ